MWSVAYATNAIWSILRLNVDRAAMLEFSRRGLGRHDPDAQRNPGGRSVISRKPTVGGLDLSHGSLSYRTGCRFPHVESQRTDRPAQSPGQSSKPDARLAAAVAGSAAAATGSRARNGPG